MASFAETVVKAAHMQEARPRVSSTKGLHVDGDSKSHAEAIAICKRRAGAMVVLEDGVDPNEWKRVEAALRAEKIEIMIRGSLGHAECWENPLAKGCQ